MGTYDPRPRALGATPSTPHQDLLMAFLRWATLHWLQSRNSMAQQSGDEQLQPWYSMTLYWGAVLSPSVGLSFPRCSRLQKRNAIGEAWHTVVTVSPISGVLLITSALAPPPLFKIDFWFTERDPSPKSSCRSHHDKPVTGLHNCTWKSLKLWKSHWRPLSTTSGQSRKQMVTS